MTSESLTDIEQKVALGLREGALLRPRDTVALVATLAQTVGEMSCYLGRTIEDMDADLAILDDMYSGVPDDVRVWIKTYQTIGFMMASGSLPGGDGPQSSGPPPRSHRTPRGSRPRGQRGEH